MTHAAPAGTILPLILLTAIPTAAILTLTPAFVRADPQAKALGFMIAAGIALRLLWLAAPPMIEDDFHRYLWDGAVLAHGYNPYTYSPAQALADANLPPVLQALAIEGRDTLTRINFPELRSIYPGTAEAVFAIAHLIAPWSLTGLRVAFFTAEIATPLLLLALLRRMGASPLWAALYWCNPFVSIVLINAAHSDALLPPLVLGALLAASRKRFIAASVLAGLAAGVKLWPVLLAPMILRPLLADWRRLIPAGAALTAVLMLTTAPLLASALAGKSGVAAYASGWANNNGVFAWANWGLHTAFPDAAASERYLRITLAAIGGLTALAVAIRPVATLTELADRALIVAAAVFFLSPAQFPWYAAWFLPLAALTRCWPLLAASALLPAYYLFFPLWQTEWSDLFFYGIALVHWLPVAGWLARRGLRSPVSRSLIPGVRP